MPEQTRDHRKVTWMATGGRRGIAHLAQSTGEARAAAVQRKTLCGKTEKAVWTPVVPTEQAKCRACARSADKRNVEVVAASELA